MFEANQNTFSSSTEILNEIKEQTRNLEKEKVKFRDERNEYKRILREQARTESFNELLLREVKAFTPIENNYIENSIKETDKGLVIHLTDIHAGISIDNYFNEYNWEVLTQRLNSYLDKIFEIKNRHNSDKALVILGGDFVSGIIHCNLRLENNSNVVQQTLMVSDMISNFIFELSKKFSYLQVGSVYGNHDRINEQKEQCAKDETFAAFIIPYLKAKLQNCNNVSFITNLYDETIGSTRFCNKLIYYTHGDKDTVSNVVQNLTMMTGEKPDFVFMGHRHTNGLTTVYNTKVVESGSVSGSDNYCMDKRLFNYPEQTASVIDAKGLDCLYDITLY